MLALGCMCWMTNIFYRQRTYYRWDNGWSRAVSPNGPWEDTVLKTSTCLNSNWLMPG